ncbi:MAG TPA: M23 family metallopeptidase [Pseudonocardiaceae bacterium]|nr:M23 family metallopeptidase [Pseudonocardiaceae bacterium]
MAADRTSGGQNSSTALPTGPAARDGAQRPPLSPPFSLLRGRAVFAAVTLGALAAAAAGQSLLPRLDHSDPAPRLSQAQELALVINTNGNNQESIDVAPAARVVDASQEAAQLAACQLITGAQQGNAPTATTVAASFVTPTAGTVTSTFGGSYGTFHYGIEISGHKDQAIVAAANGKIIAAGPTSGFGLWVKEQLADGTILVYARMDDFSVHVGQQVTAGQQIARMGDRGFATGYTLHFEVWNTDSKKIDPEAWLNSHGVIL